MTNTSDSPSVGMRMTFALGSLVLVQMQNRSGKRSDSSSSKNPLASKPKTSVNNIADRLKTEGSFKLIVKREQETRYINLSAPVKQRQDRLRFTMYES